jgi:hypothetical protein
MPSSHLRAESFKKGIEDYLESLRQGFAEGDEEEDEDDDMGRDDEDGPEDDDFVLTPPVSSSSTGKDEDKSDGPALKIKDRMVESADESASPMLKVKRRSSNSSIGSGISDGKGSGGRKKRKKKKSSNVPEAIPSTLSMLSCRQMIVFMSVICSFWFVICSDRYRRGSCRRRVPGPD